MPLPNINTAPFGAAPFNKSATLSVSVSCSPVNLSANSSMALSATRPRSRATAASYDPALSALAAPCVSAYAGATLPAAVAALTPPPTPETAAAAAKNAKPARARLFFVILKELSSTVENTLPNKYRGNANTITYAHSKTKHAANEGHARAHANPCATQQTRSHGYTLTHSALPARTVTPTRDRARGQPTNRRQ